MALEGALEAALEPSRLEFHLPESEDLVDLEVEDWVLLEVELAA